jgi:uncharacterized protein YoaH (UPF0181 family)
MEIVSISERRKEKSQDEEQKKAMLEVLDFMRKGIEEGEIKEFVACSMDEDGQPQIHVAAQDIAGSVGMYEIGKQLLIQSEF